MPPESFTGYIKAANVCAIVVGFFLFIAMAKQIWDNSGGVHDGQDGGARFNALLYATAMIVTSALVLLDEPYVDALLCLHSFLLIFEVFSFGYLTVPSIIVLRLPTLVWLVWLAS